MRKGVTEITIVLYAKSPLLFDFVLYVWSINCFHIFYFLFIFKYDDYDYTKANRTDQLNVVDGRLNSTIDYIKLDIRILICKMNLEIRWRCMSMKTNYIYICINIYQNVYDFWQYFR